MRKLLCAYSCTATHLLSNGFVASAVICMFQNIKHITCYMQLISNTFLPHTGTRRSWAASLHAVLWRVKMRPSSHCAGNQISEIFIHVDWKIPPLRNMSFSQRLTSYMDNSVYTIHQYIHINETAGVIMAFNMSREHRD
jgi:hypothetical protein